MARKRPRRSEIRKSHPGLPSPKVLGLVDIRLFLADARIPWTSVSLAEPYLGNKKRVYVLAKPDLADPGATAKWLAFFRKNGHRAFAVNCKTGEGLGVLLKFLRSEWEVLFAKRARGLLERPLRLMLFGPPNVGKSSLANRLLGTSKAPFGAKPGLTRASTWLRGRGFLEILDTPGVVDPSLVRDEARWKLAAAWALGERQYDAEDVALLVARTVYEGHDPSSSIKDYGRTRGFLESGGTVAMERAYTSFVKDFRTGVLGRFTLEMPDDHARPAEDEEEAGGTPPPPEQ